MKRRGKFRHRGTTSSKRICSPKAIRSLPGRTISRCSCPAPPLPTLEIPPNAYATAPGIIRPVSRGELKLTAADPAAPLHLDPRYLSEPADLNALVHSLEVSIEIMESPALAKWRKRSVWPQAKTRAERVQWVRETCETYHHQAGTCKMGIDAMSVVDPRLRVHGVDGLRV